jgi:hypothetical protein
VAIATARMSTARRTAQAVAGVDGPGRPHVRRAAPQEEEMWQDQADVGPLVRAPVAQRSAAAPRAGPSRG